MYSLVYVHTQKHTYTHRNQHLNRHYLPWSCHRQPRLPPAALIHINKQTYIHTCTHSYMYTHTHIHIFIHIYIYIYIYIYTFTYTHTETSTSPANVSHDHATDSTIYTPLRFRPQARVRERHAVRKIIGIHTCMRIYILHTYEHIYIRVCIHTYMHRCICTYERVPGPRQSEVLPTLMYICGVMHVCIYVV